MYSTAFGQITLSREQFTKVQDICNDIAATNEHPIFLFDVASESYLNVTMDHVNSSGDLQEDRESVDDRESYRDVDHESGVLSKSDEMQYLMNSTLGPSYGKVLVSFVVYLTYKLICPCIRCYCK